MNRRAVLVIGPPRSGTSVVAHVINALGVDFGDPSHFVDPEQQKFNPIFFELEALNQLNDEVFAHFGASFGKADWTPERADFAPPVVARFQDRIAEFIAREFGDASTPIGLKDPRFSFTLPVWEAALQRLGFDLSYVFVRRAAHTTFASNQMHNKYSDAANFRLVAQAALGARHFLDGREFHTVHYEDLLRDSETAVREICGALRLDLSLAGKARAVVRGELNHESRFSNVPRYSFFSGVIDQPSWLPDQYSLYREVSIAAREGERDKSLERERADREAAMARHEATLAGLAAAAAEKEAHLAVAEAARAQLLLKVATLESEVAAREAEASAMRAAAASRDTQIAALQGAALGREHEMVVLGATLADTDQRVQQLSLELAEREQELAALRAQWNDLIATTWRVPRPSRIARALRARFKPPG